MLRAALPALALLTLGAAAPARAATVKLGVVAPMTGPQATIGADVADALQLARRDLAARAIELQIFQVDDAGRPDVGLAALEKLATRDEVAGVVGACGAGVSDAVAKAAERYRVPLVGVAAAGDEIGRLGLRWVFRLSATPRDHVEALLDMALALGKRRTLAIVGARDEFGSSAARIAKAHAKEKGLAVVLEEAYAAGATDHRTELRNAHRARPDLVLLVARGPDAARLVRQSREVGLAPHALLTVGADLASQELARDGALADGVFLSSASAAGGPGREAFEERYRAAFGRSPSEEAAGAHAAASILAEEAVKAGGDRERIRRALEAGSWDGVAGLVRFATSRGYTHQNEHRMLVEQLQGGRRVAVWPPERATAKPLWPLPDPR